jgi:hypothetical protein
MSAQGRLFWLASYPKSGNTWLRIFLANLRQEGTDPVLINQMDSDEIASSRSWLDWALGFPTADLLPHEIDVVRPAVYASSAAARADAGYHKIHDAYNRLPDGRPVFGGAGVAGALYILRNPLDVASSAAAHWHCSIDDAIDKMAQPDFTISRGRRGLADQVPQRMGSWSQHVCSWADASEIPVCVLRYEDMLAQPEQAFGRAVDFLQLQAYAARIPQAIQHSDFKVLAGQEQAGGFKERPSKAKQFFRSGRAGAWQQQLTPAQIARIIDDHGDVMRRFGYLDAQDQPCGQPF